MLLRSALVAVASTTIVLAQVASIPKADTKGSKDHPLLKRYEGSLIAAYEQKGFDEFTIPLSPLEPVKDKRTKQNNQLYEPKTKRVLEGRYTRIAYLIPPDRSPLEVLRNYQDEIKAKQGKTLFECKAAECGGNAERSSSGGGGHMSLAMFLYPPERLIEMYGSNPWCVQGAHITDQRYAVAELPQSGAHVSVLAYTLAAATDSCKALHGRTVAIVDIIEAKDRENRMVTVDAGEMAKAIDTTGRVALYGIFFDFNSADVKPESDPTLEQIAALLKKNTGLKLLVVGHTDNVGSFQFNMDLSQRRAAAVVAVLATRYAIGKDRLTPVGVSFASPMAPNKSEEGRAKNRRVELVESAVATGK
jgi:outer membrane protein OmpA-like peptidoglycan-associated protein